MKTLTDRPPRTPLELFKILPEGTLAEVINNQIYTAASPFYRHQKLVKPYPENFQWGKNGFISFLNFKKHS